MPQSCPKYFFLFVVCAAVIGIFIFRSKLPAVWAQEAPTAAAAKPWPFQVGVNMHSFGLWSPSEQEQALQYLTSQCGVSVIRIFGTPERGGSGAVLSAVQMAARFGVKVVVALADYSNGTPGILDASVHGNPTAWYGGGYQSSGYLGYAQEVAAKLSGTGNIYALELANEPHCGGFGDCPPAYNSWAANVSAAIGKSQSVGIGQKANDKNGLGDSPPDGFRASNQVGGVSVTSGHYYLVNPAEKGIVTEAFGVAQSIGKPFYIGEMGVEKSENRAFVLQGEMEYWAGKGIDAFLYWQYSGAPANPKENDPYSFFEGDPVCDVLAGRGPKSGLVNPTGGQPPPAFKRDTNAYMVNRIKPPFTPPETFALEVPECNYIAGLKTEDDHRRISASVCHQLKLDQYIKTNQCNEKVVEPVKPIFDSPQRNGNDVTGWAPLRPNHGIAGTEADDTQSYALEEYFAGQAGLTGESDFIPGFTVSNRSPATTLGMTWEQRMQNLWAATIGGFEGDRVVLDAYDKMPTTDITNRIMGNGWGLRFTPYKLPGSSVPAYDERRNYLVNRALGGLANEYAKAHGVRKPHPLYPLDVTRIDPSPVDPNAIHDVAACYKNTDGTRSVFPKDDSSRPVRYSEIGCLDSKFPYDLTSLEGAPDKQTLCAWAYGSMPTPGGTVGGPLGAVLKAGQPGVPIADTNFLYQRPYGGSYANCWDGVLPAHEELPEVMESYISQSQLKYYDEPQDLAQYSAGLLDGSSKQRVTWGKPLMMPALIDQLIFQSRTPLANQQEAQKQATKPQEYNFCANDAVVTEPAGIGDLATRVKTRDDELKKFYEARDCVREENCLVEAQSDCSPGEPDVILGNIECNLVTSPEERALSYTQYYHPSTFNFYAQADQWLSTWEPYPWNEKNVKPAGNGFLAKDNWLKGTKVPLGSIKGSSDKPHPEGGLLARLDWIRKTVACPYPLCTGAAAQEPEEGDDSELDPSVPPEAPPPVEETPPVSTCIADRSVNPTFDTTFADIEEKFGIPPGIVKAVMTVERGAGATWENQILASTDDALVNDLLDNGAAHRDESLCYTGEPHWGPGQMTNWFWDHFGNALSVLGFDRPTDRCNYRDTAAAIALATRTHALMAQCRDKGEDSADGCYNTWYNAAKNDPQKVLDTPVTDEQYFYDGFENYHGNCTNEYARLGDRTYCDFIEAFNDPAQQCEEDRDSINPPGNQLPPPPPGHFQIEQ